MELNEKYSSCSKCFSVCLPSVSSKRLSYWFSIMRMLRLDVNRSPLKRCVAYISASLNIQHEWIHIKRQHDLHLEINTCWIKSKSCHTDHIPFSGDVIFMMGRPCYGFHPPVCGVLLFKRWQSFPWWNALAACSLGLRLDVNQTGQIPGQISGKIARYKFISFSISTSNTSWQCIQSYTSIKSCIKKRVSFFPKC